MTDEKTPSNEDELRFWFITTEHTSYGPGDIHTFTSTELFHVRDPALAFARMCRHEADRQSSTVPFGIGALGCGPISHNSPPSLISIIPATVDAAALWPGGEAIGEDGIRHPPNGSGDHPYRGPSAPRRSGPPAVFVCPTCLIPVGGVHSRGRCKQSGKIVTSEFAVIPPGC